MQEYYITEETTSPDVSSRSFEFLIANSSVKTTVMPEKYRSYGDGIISDFFYIGNNITENLIDIEVRDSSACILTMPKVGHYSINVSNQRQKNFSPHSGGIVLPVDKIIYNALTDYVNDLIIIISMNDIQPLLERNYNIIKSDNVFYKLDGKREKVAAATRYIDAILQMSRNFPQVRESLLIKNNIKEIAALTVADLIADSQNIQPNSVNSADFILVRKAEELIESECESLFTIQEIANKLAISPRKLQTSFKKFRDYTPVQFLKIRKLHKARKLLLSSGNYMTVKEVAIKVGLFDLNRFSKYYAQQFGELASETRKKLISK